MDKESIKRFIGWLEGAGREEIDQRRRVFLEARSKVSSREAKADVRLGLRLIDAEILARLEVRKARRQG
jgi:hypothetical protein